MGEIYQEALCVNISLGKPKGLVLLPLALMHRRRKFRDWTWWPIFERHKPYPHYSIRHLSSRRNSVQKVITSAYNDTCPPWHVRVWTIQEFAMAKQIYLCIGRHGLVYEKLVDLFPLRYPARDVRDLSFNFFGWKPFGVISIVASSSACNPVTTVLVQDSRPSLVFSKTPVSLRRQGQLTHGTRSTGSSIYCLPRRHS
jgi:hypothetical protein